MPSSPSPVADVLADLRRAFGALGVRWFLFGAQAAILHGVARLTADVDVTVEPGSRSNTALVAALVEAGFELRVADAGGFVEATRVLPLSHPRTRMPVDVVLAGPGLEELFMSRAQERVIADVRVPVACAEDLVTMKVLAGRPKDLEDALAMMRAQGATLDLELTRSTLSLLEKALDRRDLIPELERLERQARRSR